MFFRPKPILKNDEALFKQAKELGVSLSEIGGPVNYAIVQKRVMEAILFRRSNRLWIIAVISAVASVVSAFAAWLAVFNNPPCP